MLFHSNILNIIVNKLGIREGNRQIWKSSIYNENHYSNYGLKEKQQPSTALIVLECPLYIWALIKGVKPISKKKRGG